MRFRLVLSAMAFACHSWALAAGPLEPKTEAFVQATKGGPPIYRLGIPQARQVLENAQAGPVKKLPARVEDRSFRGGRTGEISVRIVRPEKSTGKLPVVMYFHGGGWILGSKETHDRLVRDLANAAQAAVVFVNYSPSPEAKFPTAIEQAYVATKHVAEHGQELTLDGSRLAVAGDSVGGNMAAVVTLMAKERNSPKISGQLLFYPVTDANFETPSYQEFANGPWLTKAAMEWFWNAYAPDVTERKKPTLAPLQASVEELKGLPPAAVITAENDVLRDEGEAYAQKLVQAGVEVTAVRFLGTIHDFVMLNALADTPAARNAIALAGAHLRQTLRSR
jgi:acetyl esterase